MSTLKTLELFDLGFLGGGQLARMSIQAAQRLGIHCLSLEAQRDLTGESLALQAHNSTPAGQVGPSISGKLNDPEALASLIKSCRKVTLENEFIPADALRQAFQIADRDPDDLLPGIGTLATIQDKLLQRQTLSAAGVPGPEAFPFISPEQAIEALGLPLVLKARFGGYDGKGTLIVRERDDLENHRGLQNWMAESFVPFRREIAVMVVRTQNRTLRLQTVETVQPAYVCDHTIPAHWNSSDSNGELNLGDIPERAVSALEGFGLFGVEMFELESGAVMVNEIAPRPHNTGHYSMDWGGLSQFDLHIRAVMGLPVPAQVTGTDTVMLNLLGREGELNLDRARSQLFAKNPQARLHWYGKPEMRPGRKLGHINWPGALKTQLEEALQLREEFFK